MADKTYENDSIKVHWKSDLCMHSAVCTKGLGEVFDTEKRPWINVNGASADDIARVVEQCPTGALAYERVARESDETNDATSEEPNVKVTVLKDGPVLLNGEFDVVDADGNPVETADGKAALCRCGMSATKPLCDGTHKAREWSEADGSQPA